MRSHPPIPASLLAAYRQTDYRVRLSTGGCATIRIGEPLPAALRSQVPQAAHWAFLTACNPFSTPTDRPTNRNRQRQLLHALHGLENVQAIRAGCGAGKDGWREASLFIVGLAPAAVDRLMERFEQHAAVIGCGNGRARLLAGNSSYSPQAGGSVAGAP